MTSTKFRENKTFAKFSEFTVVYAGSKGSDESKHQCSLLKGICCSHTHTAKPVLNSRTFQGFLTASPTVFKDYKSMKYTNLNFKIKLIECFTNKQGKKVSEI